MSGPAARAIANPWLIAIVVSLAAFMEVLDTTIANVALPYIAGGLGVSEDEGKVGGETRNQADGLEAAGEDSERVFDDGVEVGGAGLRGGRLQ